jgi:hypothetical protein
MGPRSRYGSRQRITLRSQARILVAKPVALGSEQVPFSVGSVAGRYRFVSLEEWAANKWEASMDLERNHGLSKPVERFSRHHELLRRPEDADGQDWAGKIITDFNGRSKPAACHAGLVSNLTLQ